MAMWDQLGQHLTTRQRMRSDLEGLEDDSLTRAYDELEQRRQQRTMPSGLGLAFNSPGSQDYFQRQAIEGDMAFLRSHLGSGERPRVRVGYAANENDTTKGDDDLFNIKQLLIKQRMKDMGFNEQTQQATGTGGYYQSNEDWKKGQGF